MLEKTLENPLDSKEIKPVHPKGNQSWIFIGRTNSEAEAAILWPPDAKNCLTGKDPDAGNNWRLEEKGRIEGKMVGWTGLISLLSKGFSRVFSSTTVENHQFFGSQPSLWSIVTSVHNSWKKHGFDYTDLCQQSDISALSRFVVAFLPRSKCPGCSHCPQWFWSPRKWNLPLYGSY